MVARGGWWQSRSPTGNLGKQDAGDHKGPHHPTSATLAPTDTDGHPTFNMTHDHIH